MSEKAPQTPLESEDSKKIEEVVEHQQFDTRDARDAAVEELGRFEEEWKSLGGYDIDVLKTQLAKAGDLRVNHETHLELYENLEDAEDKFYVSYKNAQPDEVTESREDILKQFADRHGVLTTNANEAHEKWVAIGGEAIDTASAKLAALDMYLQPGEFNDAILELEDAEAEATRRLNAHEETPLKSDTEAAPEGERLADFLESIRTAQRNEDELTLKVLLKQYEEILATKSDDPKWIQRHLDIAKTPLKVKPVTPEAQPKNKYQEQFAEAAVEASENIDAADELARRREIADEASRRADEANRQATSVPATPAQPSNPAVAPRAERTTDDTNERDAPKREGRMRKLGRWIVSMMSDKGIIERAQAKRDRNDEILERAVDIHVERKNREVNPIDDIEQAKKDARKEMKDAEKAAKVAAKKKPTTKAAVNAFRQGNQKEKARNAQVIQLRDRQNRSRQSAPEGEQNNAA